MTTVDKKFADRIIAGEFSEDNIEVIIRYENTFNGNYAYKIVSTHQVTTANMNYLMYGCESMDCPVIYWAKHPEEFTQYPRLLR